MKYIVNYSDQIGHEETLIFKDEKSILKWHNETFLEQFETYNDILNDSELFISNMSDNEFDILNGKKQIFKIKNRIVGFIKYSYSGFIFCTGRPSDNSCISWSYNNYNEALFTANEYINKKELNN